MFWDCVPLCRSTVTVTILGQTKCSIRHYNITPIIISTHPTTQVLRLLALSNPVGAEGSVVESELSHCEPSKLAKNLLPWYSQVRVSDKSRFD